MNIYINCLNPLSYEECEDLSPKTGGFSEGIHASPSHFSKFLFLLNLKSHLHVLFSLPNTKVENTSALPWFSPVLPSLACSAKSLHQEVWSAGWAGPPLKLRLLIPYEKISPRLSLCLVPQPQALCFPPFFLSRPASISSLTCSFVSYAK